MKLNGFHFASEGNRCKIERERRKSTEEQSGKKMNKDRKMKLQIEQDQNNIKMRYKYIATNYNNIPSTNSIRFSMVTKRMCSIQCVPLYDELQITHSVLPF